LHVDGSMSEETSNTGGNRKPGTFVKGDKRINRKGRPRNFDKLRALAKQIACEVIDLDDQSQVTRVEHILREWARSGDRQKQQGLLEIAYGKVPDKIEMETSVTIRPPAKIDNED